MEITYLLGVLFKNKPSSKLQTSLTKNKQSSETHGGEVLGAIVSKDIMKTTEFNYSL